MWSCAVISGVISSLCGLTGCAENRGSAEPSPGDVGLIIGDEASEDSGGDDSGSLDGASREAENPRPGWALRAELPTARQENGVAALGGELYVVGGFDDQGRIVPSVEVYNPLVDRWRPGPALPEPLHHANLGVAEGKLFVLGYLSGMGFSAVSRCFSLEPGGEAWQGCSELPEAGPRGAGGVGSFGRWIYVAGGQDGGRTTRGAAAYDAVEDSWSLIEDLPVALNHLVGAAVDGRFYVVGGRNRGINGHLTSSWVFEPSEGHWRELAPMPTSRGGLAGAVVDGRIYVFGGEGNAAVGSRGVFSAAEVYDPVTDRWQALTPMPTPRHGTGAASLDGRIHIPGGADRQAFGAVRVHEVFVP